VSIFSLGRIEFVLKGPDLIAVPNGYNQRFFSGENIHSFASFSFFAKWNILLQDFSSFKTKVFLGAVLSQVSYISIPNCRRLPNCKGFLFYFLGTGPKDWFPFNATSLFGYSPLTQKQKLEKKNVGCNVY
jgi:hypothetical protein